MCCVCVKSVNVHTTALYKGFSNTYYNNVLTLQYKKL